MTVELKGNAEYAAQIIKVNNLLTFETLDNLVGVSVNGMTALVSKDTQIGDVILAIPAGAQLSEKFARQHNLMRDQGGYLEDKRRVKAIRLRGVPSNVLTVPAPEGVAVGTLFDTLDGETFCWKYEPPIKHNTSRSALAQAKAWKRVDTKFLPEHVDTSNWYRNVEQVPADAIFTITQKIHGCSARFSNTIVKVKPTWKTRVAKFLRLPVADTEYAFVVGSRKVIKDVSNPNQNHFYDEDIWTREGRKYEDLIPRGFVVYGELVGWVSSGSPIQKNYTYGLPDPARMVNLGTWQRDPARTTPTALSTPGNSVDPVMNATSVIVTPPITRSGKPTDEQPRSDGEKTATSNPSTSTTTNKKRVSPEGNGTTFSGPNMVSHWRTSSDNRNSVPSAPKTRENSWWTTITQPVKSGASSVIPAIVRWASWGTPSKNSKPPSNISENHRDSPSSCELYVYRVATITPDGILTDLPWPAVKAFCHERGLKHVPEMFTTSMKYEAETVAEGIKDSKGLKFENDPEGSWVDSPIRLGAESPCDEGLVIRVDSERSGMPEFYKCKSQEFLEHESKLLDQDVEIFS